MQVTVVQVNAAQAVVVAIILVDGGGFSQFGESFLAELLKARAMLRRAGIVARAAPSRGFPAAGGIRVDLAEQVQGDASFGGSEVGEGTCHVAMTRVPPPVIRDGDGEVLDRVLVASLAAGNPAVGRMNVSQGQIVIGCFESGLGFLQNLRGLLRIALLEEEPALQDPHDSGHGCVPESRGKFSTFYREGECLIVLALHAQAAPLPEVRDRQQFLIVGLLFKAQHEIEMSDGIFGRLRRHGNHALRQSQVEIILQGQARTD